METFFNGKDKVICGKKWINLRLKITASSCNAFARDSKYYLSPQDERKECQDLKS